ncbi:MAG TPA: restriction endonuclease [Clostridia bacterium]|nr:restriction endonuclease [Clostridia bacterium]
MPDIQGLWSIVRQRVAEWAGRIVAAGWDAFLPFVPSLVATAVFLALIVAVGIAVRIHRDHVFHGATLRSIDAMDGTQFEEFLAVLFTHLGYRVQHVGMSHDFGADLVLTSTRCRIVVQAKRYAGNVGIGAVQEALGAVHYYRGTRGMVVASSGFTESARELAARSGIELWDRQRLAAVMARTVGRGRTVGRKPAYNVHEE